MTNNVDYGFEVKTKAVTTQGFGMNFQADKGNISIQTTGETGANGGSSLLKVGDRADQEYTGQMLNFSQKKLGTMTFNVLARPDGTNVNPGKSLSNDGDAQNYVQNDGSTAATSAASGPSRSVPGELTYMFGAKLPKQDDYKARDSRES